MKPNFSCFGRIQLILFIRGHSKISSKLDISCYVSKKNCDSRISFFDIFRHFSAFLNIIWWLVKSGRKWSKSHTWGSKVVLLGKRKSIQSNIFKLMLSNGGVESSLISHSCSWSVLLSQVSVRALILLPAGASILLYLVSFPSLIWFWVLLGWVNAYLCWALIYQSSCL